MKSKTRSLADYIATFGTFPCGGFVKPDGSNTQFKRDYDRYGRPVWSVRCLDCNRKSAKVGMRKFRAEAR